MQTLQGGVVVVVVVGRTDVLNIYGPVLVYDISPVLKVILGTETEGMLHRGAAGSSVWLHWEGWWWRWVEDVDGAQ